MRVVPFGGKKGTSKAKKEQAIKKGAGCKI